MAKKMTALQRIEDERTAKRERAERMAKLFHAGLMEAGVQLEPIALELEISTRDDETTFHSWWRRDRLETQMRTVREGFEKNYLPAVTFHGSRDAAPGEATTASMWLAAEKAGEPLTLSAAILLSVIRSLDHSTRRDGEVASDTIDELRAWAYEQLESAGIDTYTRSLTRHLPERFALSRPVEDAAQVVSQLVAMTSQFLLDWSPVRVLVGDSHRRQPLQPAPGTGT